MSRPRYKVATVHGDLWPRAGNRRSREHLSAHVLDCPNAHRVVATFRSEDAADRHGDAAGQDRRRRIGREVAVAAATALAAEWNAEEDRTNRRAPAKVPPGETTTRARRGRV